MRLKGKKALITGGSSGIGLATAIAFNKEGAKVLISGRNKLSLEKACKKIGDDSSFVVADVSNVLQINSLFSEAAKYLAEIDIEDFETGEKIGYWRGEPEDSNLMVIIRKAEDGDVYDGLLNVVRMANTVLKQDAILISKTDLSEVDFVS